MNQLQMNIGQFQAAKIRPRVDKTRLRVKKNLHRADSDRLPQIALKPGSGSVGFALGGFHLEQCQQKIIGTEITGPEVIRPEVIGPKVIGPEAIVPEVIVPEVIGAEAIGLGTIGLEAVGLEAMGLEAMALETISLEAELPEVLFDGMRAFIAANPSWNQYSLITSALACFLFQNGCSDKCVTQHYLDSLFSRN